MDRKTNADKKALLQAEANKLRAMLGEGQRAYAPAYVGAMA